MKVCFTTFIYGNKYQDFIPLTLYSVFRSYPNYFVIFFVNGNLRSDLKPLIEIIRNQFTNFEIIENVFDDCPNMGPLKAQGLRWVCWTEKFQDFDYLYYIDADMLYIKEPIPMHVQHIQHMSFIGSDCVSNILRKKELSNIDFKLLYYSFRYSESFYFFKYFFTPLVYRMSGLHFVKVRPYFNYLTQDVIETFRKLFYKNKEYARTLIPNDEVLLYQMMQISGCEMSKFAVQNTSTSMFGFDNPLKKEFCPHHGFHMGIFKTDISDIPGWAISQLESEDYSYYLQQFKRDYLNDELFNQLLDGSSDDLKLKFSRLKQFYSIV